MMDRLRFEWVMVIVLAFGSAAFGQETPAAKPAPPGNPATQAEGRRISMKQRKQMLMDAMRADPPDSVKARNALTDIGNAEFFFVKGPLDKEPAPEGLSMGVGVQHWDEGVFLAYTEGLNRQEDGPPPADWIDRLAAGKKDGFELRYAKLVIAPTAQTRAERDRLLSEVEARIRKDFVELSKQFPILQNAARGWLDRGVGQAAKGRIRIGAEQRPAANADPYYFYVKIEPQYFYGRGEPCPQTAGRGLLYAHLGIVREVEAKAGDPKLDAALKKLAEDALTRIEELNRRAAAQEGDMSEPAAQPSPAALATQPEDYSGFSRLPDAEKGHIVWRLHHDRKWGRADQKPICRDLLATQPRYVGANTSFILDAIDLADQQGWTDLTPLIEGIYEHPKNIGAYERAFCFLRKQLSKPVPPDVVAAAKTLRRAGWYQSIVTNEQLKAAQALLVGSPDKEAVLVYAIGVAGGHSGKGGTDRGVKEAVDVLKSLDRKTVESRIKQLIQDAQDDFARESIDWIPGYLKSDSPAPAGNSATRPETAGKP